MVVFLFLEHFRFIEKRSCTPVASLDQTLDSLFIDCVAHNEKSILIEGLSLLLC